MPPSIFCGVKGHLVEQVVRRDVAEVYVCVHGVREDKMVGEEEAEDCCEIEKAVGLQIFCVLYGEAEGNGMPWLG